MPILDFVDWASPTYDGSLVDRFDSRFRALKAEFDQADLDRASEVVRRYAAIDTGAIEGLYKVDRGFTKTVATQSAAWQTALIAKGDKARRAIEDALAAYEYILDVTTGSTEISEMWIRSLHEVICRSQDTYVVETEVGLQDQPLPKGVYKTLPNSPQSLSTGVVHHYADPLETPTEMARLIANLRSQAFAEAHPILQAAYAHYAYVCIHPFADGNGRVARALASVYLYRAPGVPLLIFADQRDIYLDALEAADAGDANAFIGFVEERAIDAVGLLEASLIAARRSRVGGAPIVQLQSIYNPDPGLEKRQLLGQRVRELCRAALSKAIADLELPRQIQADVIAIGSDLSNPPGWASFGGEGKFRAWVRSDYPHAFSINFDFQVLVRADRAGGNEPDLLVVPDEPLFLEVWARDVDPTESESLRLRMGLWADASAATIAEKIVQQLPTGE